MIKVPVLAAAAAGTAVVGGIAAVLVFSGPSALTLPTEAYSEDTIVAYVVDLNQFDEDAVDTIEETLTDLFEDLGEMTGEPMPARQQREFDEAMDKLDDVAETIQDHDIDAFAVTLHLDWDQIFDNTGPDSGMMVSMLIKAGDEPDLVKLVTDISEDFGEAPPPDMIQMLEETVELNELGGGWYAIEVDGPQGEMLGLPSGGGDSETAEVFNDALAETAGGMLQVAVTLPDFNDLLQMVPDSGQALDLYSEMPDEVQDMLGLFDDMEVIGYAVDMEDGLGFRAYMVFDGSDAAKEMMEAMEQYEEDLPTIFDDLAETSDMSEEEVARLRDASVAMMDLVDYSRSGSTVEMEMDGDALGEMMDLAMEMMAPAMAGSRDRALQMEREAYGEHWEDHAGEQPHWERSGDDGEPRDFGDQDREFPAEEAADEAIDEATGEVEEPAYEPRLRFE